MLFQEISLLKSAFGSLVSKFSSVLVVFLLNVLLARMMTIEEFGLYTLLISGVMFAASFSVLGLPLYITREVARLRKKNNVPRVNGLIKESYEVVFIGGLAVTVVFFVALSFDWIAIEKNFFLIVSIVLMYTITGFNQVRAAVLRGLHYIVIADIPELIFKPIVVLLFLIIFYMVNERELKATDVLMMQLCAVFFSFLFGAYLLARKRPRLMNKENYFLRDKWVPEVSSFFLLTILNLFQGQSGIYILGFYTEVSQVGLFQVATQLVAVIVVGLSSVNLALQPRFSAACATTDTNKLRGLASIAVLLSSIIAISLSVILLTWSDFFIGLFGEKYAESVSILKVLVYGQVLNALFGSCGVLMVAAGYQYKLLIYNLYSSIVSVALMLFLVNYYQGVGVAWGVLSYFIVLNVLMASFVYKEMKVNTTIFSFLKVRPSVF